MTDKAKPRLPAGHEFSPGQVELTKVLKIISDHKGDNVDIVEAIRTIYFPHAAASHGDPASRLKQQTKRANNVLIGMQCYQLFNREHAGLTTLGQELLAEKNKKARQERFAKHILTNLHGNEVIQTIIRLQRQSVGVTKGSLHRELERGGFELPRATTHHLTMINWMRKAGLFKGDHGYVVDDNRYRDLVGTSNENLIEFSLLNFPQRCVLFEIRRRSAVNPPNTTFAAKEVVDSIEGDLGRNIFRGDTLRREVFVPLEKGGWLTTDGLSKGRGAKSGLVMPTEKLLSISTDLLSPGISDNIPAEVRGILQERSTKEIVLDLKSSNTHKKGLALEALAVKIAQDLGLEPVFLRERSAATGGAEVDLVAEGVHLHYSRWLCQCKNQTSAVHVAAIAKEVGLAVVTKAHVVMLVTTSTFARPVYEFAQRLAHTSHLQAVLVDGQVLGSYVKSGPNALKEKLIATAGVTRDLKRGQMMGISAEEGTQTPPSGGE